MQCFYIVPVLFVCLRRTGHRAATILKCATCGTSRASGWWFRKQFFVYAFYPSWVEAFKYRLLCGCRYMKTCQQCPQQYPWTGNTGVPYSNSV